ncbi:SRPBCC domain-containing protein [Paenibacillus solisilvae]|uniref:SRPBCC domain-containing protein n=1 Tax=Paenibacillus solisilvae TaxID=2486751 RepID=A0ABW0VYD6_9BACL
MDLTYETYIGGTLEQVWKAIVDAEYVKQVYYGSVIESTFQAGDSLAYVGPGSQGERTTHVFGSILTCESNRELSFRHFTGKAYNPETDKYESRVTYQLEKIGEAVKLTLIHDQWKENDPSYEGSKKSWPMLLSNTKTLVETGKTLKFT